MRNTPTETKKQPDQARLTSSSMVSDPAPVLADNSARPGLGLSQRLSNLALFTRRFSAEEIEEREEVLETTEIAGLYWIRNYFLKTSEFSRIVLPNPGQSNFTAVYHGADFSNAAHGGYEVYGIHMGQVDVLTFMTGDDRTMSGHFVDCRAGSPTLHKHTRLEFQSDPDRALVIERGIAHIFDNLVGMTTLNQMRLYWDYNNPDFDPNIDVLNVLRATPPDQFPVVQINRYTAPGWLCRLARKAQRIQLRHGIKVYHPYRFKLAGRTYTLTPKEMLAAQGVNTLTGGEATEGKGLEEQKREREHALELSRVAPPWLSKN